MSIQINEANIISSILFKKYKIMKLINKGSFGYIFKAKNILTNQLVAVKIEQRATQNFCLEHESKMLFNLKGGIGIPKLITFGYSGSYNVMVQQLLGKTILDIFILSKRKMKLKDAAMIAIQIMDRMEYIHSKNIIHRDIKPENFLIGNPDNYIIYLIDFGFSKKYKSTRTGKHIPFKLLYKLTGTPRFVSINASKGTEQSRRDDLESVGHMLIFLLKGFLPWQKFEHINLSKFEEINQVFLMKKNLSVKELCKDLPPQIGEYLLYCRKLKFEQKPDYDYCRGLFIKILFDLQTSYDLKFSWISVKNINRNINSANCSDIFKKKETIYGRLLKRIQKSLDEIKDKKEEEDETEWDFLESELKNPKNNNLDTKKIKKNNINILENDLSNNECVNDEDIESIDTFYNLDLKNILNDPVDDNGNNGIYFNANDKKKKTKKIINDKKTVKKRKEGNYTIVSKKQNVKNTPIIFDKVKNFSNHFERCKDEFNGLNHKRYEATKNKKLYEQNNSWEFLNQYNNKKNGKSLFSEVKNKFENSMMDKKNNQKENNSNFVVNKNIINYNIFNMYEKNKNKNSLTKIQRNNGIFSPNKILTNNLNLTNLNSEEIPPKKHQKIDFFITQRNNSYSFKTYNKFNDQLLNNSSPVKFNENKFYIYKSRYSCHEKYKINTCTKSNNKEIQCSKAFNLPINNKKKIYFRLKEPKIYRSIRKNSKVLFPRDKDTENYSKFRKINKNNTYRYTNFVPFIYGNINNTYNKIIEKNNISKNNSTTLSFRKKSNSLINKEKI